MVIFFFGGGERISLGVMSFYMHTLRNLDDSENGTCQIGPKHIPIHIG